MPQGKVYINFANPMICQPKTDKDLAAVKSSFGFFGDPPPSAFDPKTDVPNDVIPKEEDYVYIPFRMLTATIVGGGTWKATDFSAKGVLKKSTQKMLYKQVFINHQMSDVLSNVGIVVAVKWTDEFTAPDGTIVPGGIDGLFRIDAKSHPRIARDLLSKPPTIQSDSVTVLYQYEPSHTFTTSDDDEPDMWEFERNLGKMVNGKMVTRKVTEIEDYYEVSLVSMGADPFGKIKVDAEGKASIDGVPLNIDKSGIVPESAYNKVYTGTSFDKDPLKTVYTDKSEYFVTASFLKENNLHLKNRVLSNNQKRQKPTAMNELLTFIAVQLGISADDLTEESAAEALKKYKFVAEADYTKLNAASLKLPTVLQEVSTLKADKVTLAESVKEKETEITTLKKDVETLTPEAEIGRNLLKAKKEEAKKLYRVSAGTKADDAFIAIIDKSDEKEVNAILKNYGATVMETFAGTCKKCKSTEIDFRSTVPDKDDTTEPTGNSSHLAFSFNR